MKPIFTLNASTDAVLRKDVPFGGPEDKLLYFDPFSSENRHFWTKFRRDCLFLTSNGLQYCDAVGLKWGAYTMTVKQKHGQTSGFSCSVLPLLVECQEGRPACKNPLVGPQILYVLPFWGGISGDPALPRGKPGKMGQV